MQGTIEQVSVSRGGIPKAAILSGVVTKRGIATDSCRNRRYHGGPDQAILLITAEGIDELTSAGYPLYPGALGENITTRGLDRKAVRIGHKFRIHEALIEVTKLRVPCVTLDVYGPSIKAALYDKAVKSGDYTSPRWGLGGFYARVLETGNVMPGAIIALVD